MAAYRGRSTLTLGLLCMRVPDLLLASSLLLPLSAASATCLHYLGAPVTLIGTVTLRTFYGPPNYGENPSTDARETQAILLLDKPICVEANPSDSDDAETGQLQVTVVPLAGTDLRRFEGAKVEVSGVLFHANTGHHHTAVLIDLRREEDIRAQ
jgi:hypothetical protein